MTSSSPDCHPHKGLLVSRGASQPNPGSEFNMPGVQDDIPDKKAKVVGCRGVEEGLGFRV